MSRDAFIKKLIRYALVSVMILLIFLLRRKEVIGQDCSSCPVNGVCNGKSDCYKN